MLSPDETIDIPVKELSDSLMIKIMANENMEEYRVSPGIIDETVKVAKQFLSEHSEEAKIYKGHGPNQIGAKAISLFLGWGIRRVSYSLERLRLTEEKKIDKAVNKLPTERAARDFVKATKKWNLEPEKQAEVIRKIVDGSNYGYDQERNRFTGKLIES